MTRINHAVLYVRDAQRTATFYEEVLDFRRVGMIDGFDGAVFLQAPGSTNDHDLGLFTIGEGAGPSGAGRQTVGLYHLAWEVDTLAELERIAGLLSPEVPWSAPATTARPRPCTPTIPMASSSRCPGWSPPTSSTRRRWRRGHASSPSTSKRRYAVTAPRPAAESGSRPRRDRGRGCTGGGSLPSPPSGEVPESG